MKWSELKMFPRIEIIKETDEFNREVYSFSLVGSKLILDDFKIEKRESKRHKFKAVKIYDRHRKRESTLTIDQVVLTEDIKQEVINKMISLVEENK
jgi:hypothetical protein